MGILDEQVRKALESTFGQRLEEASEETRLLRQEMEDVRRELERRNDLIEEQTNLLEDIRDDL